MPGRDILAIVGPRSFADVQAFTVMRDVITTYLAEFPPDEIWSGGAEGGDLFAETLAREFGYPFKAILPRRLKWDGEGGYRDRDEFMAARCTRLLGFSCRWPASGGAIWTAQRARQLGKPVVRHTVPATAAWGRAEIWPKGGELIHVLVEEGKISRVADGAPDYAQQWPGQPVDTVLSRQRKSGARVRWTSGA